MPLILTSLNGLYYDQTSVRCSVAGIALAEHLKDISFSDTLTPTVIRGTHPIKLGRGLGTVDSDGSFQILEEAWEVLQPQIAAKSVSGSDLATVIFDVQISFVTVLGGRVNNVAMHECGILGRKFPTKNSADGMVREIPLFVRWIDEGNGITLVPRQLP